MAFVYPDYSGNFRRKFPFNAIAIDGVNAGIDKATWEDYTEFGDGHPGWERGYYVVPTTNCVIVWWRYNGSVLHFEVMSAEPSLSIEHYVQYECATFKIQGECGLAWSDEEAIQSLFVTTGSTMFDGKVDAYFEKSWDKFDGPVTNITGSPRMQFVWPIERWVKDGISPKLLNYMDELLRYQVHRPYQWPNLANRGLTTGLKTFDGTGGCPVTPVYGLNQFGMNSWDNAHFDIIRLALIYKITRWPRALDQLIRLYFAAYHETGWKYWLPSAPQVYGESARVAGWMIAASAIVMNTLRIADSQLAGPPSPNPSAPTYTLYTRVRERVEWHIDNHWGPPSDPLSGPGPGNVNWTYEGESAKKGVYPFEHTSQTSGHIAETGYRVGFMTGVHAYGMRMLFHTWVTHGLYTPGDPLDYGYRALIMAYDCCNYADQYGYLETEFSDEECNVEGGNIVNNGPTNGLEFGDRVPLHWSKSCYFGRFKPGTVRLTVTTSQGVSVYKDTYVGGIDADHGTFVHLSGPNIPVSDSKIQFTSDGGRCSTVVLKLVEPILSATLDAKVFNWYTSSPNYGAEVLLVAFPIPDVTADAATYKYKAGGLKSGQIIYEKDGAFSLIENVWDPLLYESYTIGSYTFQFVGNVLPGSVVITAQTASGELEFTDDGLKGFTQTAGTAVTINSGSVSYDAITDSNHSSICKLSFALDLDVAITSAVVSFKVFSTLYDIPWDPSVYNRLTHTEPLSTGMFCYWPQREMESLVQGAGDPTFRYKMAEAIGAIYVNSSYYDPQIPEYHAGYISHELTIYQGADASYLYPYP